MRLQLPKGKAATIEFYPAEGPPSSVSVELLISGTTALVASPSASVDSLSENLTQAASEEDLVIYLDTTSVTIDRDYWLQTSGGRRELVRVVDKTATTATLEQPLSFAVPTSGSLVGARCSVALSTSDTANRYRRCEARWTYTAGGVVRYASQRFDIVERPFHLNVPESLIETVWPAFGEYKGVRDAWKNHVAYAQDQIEFWLDSRQIEPDLVRETRWLERAAAHIVSARMHQDSEFSEMHRVESDRILSMLESMHQWYDEDEDLAVDNGAESIDGHSEVGPRVRYMGIG